MSYMSFQIAQQMKAQKLASEGKKQNIEAKKGDLKVNPTKISTFGNDKKADAGVFESEARESVADTGSNAPTFQVAESGTVENTPTSYDQDVQVADDQPQQEFEGEE